MDIIHSRLIWPRGQFSENWQDVYRTSSLAGAPGSPRFLPQPSGRWRAGRRAGWRWRWRAGRRAGRAGPGVPSRGRL